MQQPLFKQNRPIRKLNKFPNRSNGFGLLEILLTIAVAALIAIISVGYYSNVRKEQKINEFINQLVTLAHNISAYVNANANNPANQDLTKIFGVNGQTDVAQNLINKGIVQAGSITNVWNPSSIYGVYVTMGGGVNGTNCLEIGAAAGVLPWENKTSCDIIRSKLYAALQHPPLKDVAVYCDSGISLTVYYCAD